MNISSSNYFSASASTNKGISGLASGMDTEGMVEKMLSGVQSQIDKQKGLYKQTEWKQGIYQDLISQINSFAAKYFDPAFGSSLLNNLTNSEFFGSNISKVTSGDAVSILGAGSSALQGDMSIIVEKLATAAKLTGNDTAIGAGNTTLTGAKIDADFLQKEFGNELNLTLTTTTYADPDNPDLDNPILTPTDITIDLTGVTAVADITTKISDALGAAGANSTSVKFNGGVLSFEAGEDQTLTVKDTSSKLLLQKLGLSNTVGRALAKVSGNTPINMDLKPSAAFTITFDGVSKLITLDNLTDASGNVTADTLKNALSEQVKSAFGDYISVGMTADRELTLTMNIPNNEKGHQLTITGGGQLGFDFGASTSVNSYTKLSALGATPDTDAEGKSVYTFTINGQDFTLGADLTMGDLLAAVNRSDAGVTLGFSALDGQFTMTSIRTGEKYGIDAQDTGNSGLITKLFGGTTTAQGEDAKVEINGVRTSRDSNTFTVDGITLQLTKESGKNADGSFVKTVIGTAKDTDKIVTGIKGFVDDYNVLVEKIHDYLKEDASYRDYQPLTDAQKKDMSESEIKDWEEKAQEGLLRNDPTLSGFLQSMRGIMYMKPDSADLALYDIGIETTRGILDQFGKLAIDETKLRNAISNDPTSVSNLFTARDYSADETDGTKQGIAHLLSYTLTSYAKVATGSPGLLVEMAGDKDSSTYKTQNDMYQSLQRIKDRIETLQDKYERDRQRYWNQFNSMETALASFNSQSLMLSQQFSGGY